MNWLEYTNILLKVDIHLNSARLFVDVLVLYTIGKPKDETQVYSVEEEYNLVLASQVWSTDQQHQHHLGAWRRT